MARVNRTKIKILEGQVALGGSINFYAPVLVEQYGIMGFASVWIDREHGSYNDSETENMVRAAELYDLIPMVRVPCQEASLLGANFSDAKVWPLVAISAARGTGPRTTLSPEPRLRPVLCRS